MPEIMLLKSESPARLQIVARRLISVIGWPCDREKQKPALKPDF